MYSLNLGILVLASIANLTIGTLSFLKNNRNLTHGLFAVLSITLVGWTTANYFSVTLTNPDHIFLAVKSLLFFVVLQNTCFFLFVSAYPGNTFDLKPKKLAIYLSFSLVTLVAGVSPGFFTDYRLTNNSISPQPSPSMILFVSHTAISIVFGIRKLIHRFKTSKRLARNQFKFLLLASSVLFLVTPATNFVLPNLLSTSGFARLSPVYTLIFASLIAYSMVKHRLLDFRVLVAKAFAYAFTILFLAAVYAGAAFSITSLFVDTGRITTKTQIIYTAIAVIMAFSFQGVKVFFDKVSNKLFFRDAYNPQEFLNSLNQVLVEKVELEPLLNNSLRIIDENIKSDHSAFVIRETSYFSLRVIGDNKLIDETLIEQLSAQSIKVHSKVIVTDYLEDKHQELRKTLSDANVAVLVRLVPTLDYEVKGVGYLVLGSKRNGNTYDNQDIQILEILANELVIAIENGLRYEEIDKFNVTLQDKIDEATTQLKVTNKKLKQMDETKDEFISMASHQLRTPLTSVKGYLSMVLEGDAGDVSDMQRKLLNQAFISSQRMVYLIADLLNVSRLRTGKFVIESQPSNLAEVIKSEVEQLQETAQARNLKLVYDKPKDFPILMVDETKLRQVIMNFMDNAIYYTPSGGHIAVQLKETEEAIEFTVTDDGMGVPKAEQHYMFNKFYRAGNARKARPDGTGLGLFMAKKVIMAQGGSIVFRSQEGKGSTFGFTFAKAKLAVPQAVLAETIIAPK